MFSFEDLTIVMDAAELLQPQFIHLEPCDKHREMTQVHCGMSEVLPVGLLFYQGIVLCSECSECFNGHFFVMCGETYLCF
jgi:hypothetical protein